MAYIAKENIGDFMKGDIVPDEMAKVWNEMYKEPVCEEKVSSKPVEDVKPILAKKATKKSLFTKK